MILNTKIVFILHQFIAVLMSYPIVESDFGNKFKKIEKEYPNGTVICKFSYNDTEGNPIQVRYFADNSSYGIELNSVIVRNVTSNDSMMSIMQYPEEGGKILLDIENPYEPESNHFQQWNDENKGSKDTNIGEHKISPDYDVYYGNELKPSRKCDKENVHVYLDKAKREIRETPLSYIEAVQYCEQFEINV